MANRLELTLNPAALHGMLHGEGEFLPPQQLLAGLSAEQACDTVPGFPHSIATLLGHMLYWLEWCQGLIHGQEQPETTPELNFPAVAPEQWPGLVQRFLDLLPALEALATPEVCAREMPHGHSAGFMLASHAYHNAYHWGQVVMLRRALGLWPPQPA